MVLSNRYVRAGGCVTIGEDGSLRLSRAEVQSRVPWPSDYFHFTGNGEFRNRIEFGPVV